jgi:hypothetical protein
VPNRCTHSVLCVQANTLVHDPKAYSRAACPVWIIKNQALQGACSPCNAARVVCKLFSYMTIS